MGIKEALFGIVMAVLGIALRVGLRLVIQFFARWFAHVAVESISSVIKNIAENIKQAVKPDLMQRISNELDRNKEFNRQVMHFLSNNDLDNMTASQFAEGLVSLDEFQVIFDRILAHEGIEPDSLKKRLILKSVKDAMEHRFISGSEQVYKRIKKRFPELVTKDVLQKEDDG